MTWYFCMCFHCRIWLTAVCTWDLASWRLQSLFGLERRLSQETEQTIIHLRRLGLGNGTARFPRQNDSKPAWSFLWLNSSTVGLGSATMPWYASSLQEFWEIHLALAEQFIAIPMAKHVAHLRHHGVRPVGLRVLWSWGC